MLTVRNLLIFLFLAATPALSGCMEDALAHGMRRRAMVGKNKAPSGAAYSSSHALNLGGTNETVQFTHLDTDNASRAVWSFWLHNASTVADEEILNQYDTGAGTYHWSIRSIATRTIRWFLIAADCSGSVQATVDTAYSGGDFVHICLTFDGTQGSNATRMRAYLDGVESTQTFSGTAPTNLCNNADTQPLYFGSFEGSGNFAAFVLDEVAIWVGGSPPSCETIYNSRTLLDVTAMSPAPAFCTSFNGDTIPTIEDDCGSNDGTAANMEAGDIDSADVAP